MTPSSDSGIKTFVDIGSGLGHLASYLLHFAPNTSSESLKIIAMESDDYLHSKSEAAANCSIVRLRFHLTKSNLDEAISL
ncbi:hypothetical protein Ciccas_013578 [Cichlidogyrus casuarinus]|uniref:Uncharacterized protein n=1 Tax=Cichlidogyrus casuarinus TaxID=1844966 RepID=A0ABD2PK79_9PLAT